MANERWQRGGAYGWCQIRSKYRERKEEGWRRGNYTYLVRGSFRALVSPWVPFAPLGAKESWGEYLVPACMLWTVPIHRAESVMRGQWNLWETRNLRIVQATAASWPPKQDGQGQVVSNAMYNVHDLFSYIPNNRLSPIVQAKAAKTERSSNYCDSQISA